MQHVVEVAHLINGDLVSVRRLSARSERLAAFSAALSAGLLTLGAMTVGAVAIRAFGRGIYAPGFGLLWAMTGVVVAALAVAVVRRRLRRYALGSRLDADAFAPMEFDLVRRSADGFELTLIPGMTGQVANGRAPLPVEALVGDRPRTIAFDQEANAELTLGSSTFVVRSAPAGASPAPEGQGRSVFSRDLWKLFSRVAIVGSEVALIGSLFCAVPLGQTIGDRAAHLVAPQITTPWEAEKWLRIEAQAQAQSLYQCFDPLPVACLQPGYLGVGVSLTRDGEVRSNWISRSTYGAACSVDQCVKDVVSTWVFDPLPEPMRVVLPVQVLRTAKPLPTKLAASVQAEELVQAQVDLPGDATIEWTSGHWANGHWETRR
jgi:hypothetical protein